MRYYLVEGTSSGGPPSLWSRILAGVILAALVALGVVLFIFFFYVFLVVAAAAVFLASDAARYITGQVLAVNGGLYM